MNNNNNNINNNFYCNLNELFCCPKKIRNYLTTNNIAINKRLGQNFLINLNLINKIISSANISNQAIVEVGAGLGTLTYNLAKTAKKVVAIELDGGLFRLLQHNFKNVKNVEFLNCDVLKINLQNLIENEFNEFKFNVKICANLPYYITSKFIATVLESRLPISELILMVQKEAAIRLCAQPGSKACGAISYLIHYYCSPKILFSVDRHNFYPAPKVDSCIIKLKIKKPKPYENQLNEPAFFNLIKVAFSQRRKILITPLAKHMQCEKIAIKKIFQKLNLNLNARPENLTLQQFKLLHAHLQSLKQHKVN